MPQNHPLELYRFFRDDLGALAADLGWSKRPGGDPPLYTINGNLVTNRSVQAEPYGRFLVAIFDGWVSKDVGTVFVQHFDSALANWLGMPGAVCVFTETCG